jgi:hypothetical protein
LFNCKKKSIGYEKAIIVLAREVITTMHLIATGEIHEGEEDRKRGKSKGNDC